MRWMVAVVGIAFPGSLVACAVSAPETDRAASTGEALALAPEPPWPAGDERGMGNTQGYGTRLRCAAHLLNPLSREYELSHVRSATMPANPFSAPLEYTYHPTSAVPYSRHAFNGEEICGEISGQGTQFDALGHFAVLPSTWDPATGAAPVQNATYYGGYTQAQVKPTPESPLLRLGIDKVRPIVTSAVLLNARSYLGNGQRLTAGQLITAADILGMLNAQGLSSRGLLPGDVLYIYTGWEDLWQDPDITGEYYSKGPGLAVDATLLLAAEAIVAVGMDVPFVDAVNEGQLQGLAPPPADRPPGLPFFVHHQNLTQAGIHLLENMRLSEIAGDSAWLSCTMILPLRERGGSGSAVRPVAYGASRR